jgi:hypothetical protein
MIFITAAVEFAACGIASSLDIRVARSGLPAIVSVKFVFTGNQPKEIGHDISRGGYSGLPRHGPEYRDCIDPTHFHLTARVAATDDGAPFFEREFRKTFDRDDL